MSFSQEFSESSIAVQAPEPIPLKVPNEPVNLCEKCRTAHDELLRYDGWTWGLADNSADNYTRYPFSFFPVTNIHSLRSDEWPGLPSLLDSARTGCPFCNLLQEAFKSTRFHDAFKRLAGRATFEVGRTQISLNLQYLVETPTMPVSGAQDGPLPTRGLRNLIVTGTFATKMRLFLRFKLETDPDDPKVGKWLRLGPPAKRNHDDDKTISFLRSQLQKCPVSQEIEQSKANFLPKRLIDVGVSSLRLVEQVDIMAGSAGQPQPQYCALSYCWGPREDAKFQTKTTTENLGRHLKSLDFNTLSEVLQDAVRTTRDIGIPYLWVDSLCILQDDISDWQAQCSEMNDIYGKARVTLIAASSRTCKEGFLNPDRLMQARRFPYQSARCSSISGSFIMRLTHVFGDAEFALESPALCNDLRNDLTFSQWARRGWTFQEDAMAGTRIVFGSSSVYFARDGEYISKDGRVVSNDQKSLKSVQAQSNEELHRSWEKIILRYAAFTRSSFTEQTDLLPALSGLARLFGRALNANSEPGKWDYIAGHWVDRMPFTLLWVEKSEGVRPCLNKIENRHTQEPYLIPTWSCLTRGKVRSLLEYDARNCKSEIIIRDVHMCPSLEHGDMYSAIQKNAYLTLEGFVVDLASLSWSESPESLLGSAGSHAEGIRFGKLDARHDGIPPRELVFNFVELRSGFVEVDEFNNPIEEGLKETSYPFVKYVLFLDFQLEPGNRSKLGEIRAVFEQLISRATFLLVAAQETYEDNDLRISGVCGLVLVPFAGASGRSFLRVGAFQSYGGQDSDCFLPHLKRLMKKETIRLF